MTKQEIYNTVATHLLSMPERALDPSLGVCLYRAPNGSKCAVGILLTDEEAKVADEAESNVENLYHAELLPDRLVPSMDLLGDLQNIHDAEANWFDDKAGMRLKLTRLCEKYDVNPVY